MNGPGLRSAGTFESVRVRGAPANVANLDTAVSAKSDRTVENLVLTVFWLLLLEGALRKWVAPQFAQYLFFIRDPFVLLIYWHAIRKNAFRGSGPLLQIGLGFAFVAVFLAFVQSVTFSNPRLMTVALYGWRQYFLYLPLPFAMAALLTPDSITRFARHAFIAVLVMAPLVVLQASQPPSAVVNRGIAEDESLQFQSFAYTGGKIRPSGTFTSAQGIKELIPSTFALLLALWLTPPARRKIRAPMLILAAAATGTCLAVCGSRSAFVHLFLVVLSALLLGLISRAGAIRGRALSLPLALVAAGAILYPIAFPDALSLLMNRVAEASGGANAASVVLSRGFGETLDFVGFLSHTPLTGYGLGLGGNGRTYLGSTDPVLMARITAESDWSRHIVDLGTIFGVLFILYRIVFVSVLFADVLKAARTANTALPLLLFGYVGIGLFYGQLTGHGTVGGFIWLYLGLCMASCRHAKEQG